ncbi:MAG: hypothetical protein HY547_07810 [Elusimicrobia bacterium]|nr:hypothetical protein [Elusimicrobiota bacterium]
MIKKRILLILSLVYALGLGTLDSRAEGTALTGSVPSGINYQGRLEDNGTAVNATKSLTFKLYDASTGGSLLWNSGALSIAVNSGLFNTSLAIPISALSGNTTRYLEVTVGTVTLSPREILNAVPYALVAKTLEGSLDIARGGLSVSTGTAASSALYVSSSTGYVGVGTANPSAKLHIGGTSGVDGIRFPDGTVMTSANVGLSGSVSAGTVTFNGNVGIGTTLPKVSLHNNGDFITKGPWVDVRAHGHSLSTTNGTDDWTTAIASAMAALPTAGGEVLFPVGIYLVKNTLILGSNITFRGLGNKTSRIIKGFNGDLINLGENSGFINMGLEGDGGNYTGRGIVISNDAGRQFVIGSRIVDFDGYCVEFEQTTSGSQSIFLNSQISRYNGTASGRYAVKIKDEQQLSAYPRKFIGIESSGTKFIDLGGCNDIMISASVIGAVLFSQNSRGVMITGNRLGMNETQMNIVGNNIAISGNDISPAITLTPGALGVTMMGNTYNSTVTDTSGTWTNNLEIAYKEYTPTLTSGGVAPSIGNGIIRGSYSRMGNMVNLCVELTMGGTTTLGAGDVKFSMPDEIAPYHAYQQVSVGVAYARDDSAPTIKTGIVTMLPSDKALGFYFDGSISGLAYNWPFVWAANDAIRGCITYTR